MQPIEELRYPDLWIDRADEDKVYFDSPNRLVGIEWPAITYLQTLLLKKAAVDLKVRFCAVHQGFTNSAHCWIGLRVKPADSEHHIDVRLATVSNSPTFYTDDLESSSIKQHLKKGSVISIIAVSAPWRGYAAHIRGAMILVWYAHRDRYGMAVLKALLDTLDVKTVHDIFLPTTEVNHEYQSWGSSYFPRLTGRIFPRLIDWHSNARAVSHRRTRRALAFLFCKCDLLVFGIIVKFAYD